MSRASTAPKSARRVKAAAAVDAETVTFKKGDVSDWAEWFDSDDRHFMEVVEAAECLAHSANVWCDAWNKSTGRDCGSDPKFDEIEEARAQIMKHLLMLRTNHRYVRDRLYEAATGIKIESVVRT